MSNTTLDIRNHPNQLEELTRVIIETLDSPDSNVIQFNLVSKSTSSAPTTLYLYGSHTSLIPTDHKLTITTTLTDNTLKTAFNSGRFRLDDMEIDYDSTKVLFFYTVTYFK